MGKKIVINVGVARGPKAGCRLKRLDLSAEIIIVDRDRDVSYGGCGIHYYVGGDVTDIEVLQSTGAHVFRDSRFFLPMSRASRCVRKPTSYQDTKQEMT